MNRVINRTLSDYDLTVQSFQNLSEKSTKIHCENGNCYFAKKTNVEVNSKYNFLNALQIQNVVYPIQNKKGDYISPNDNDYYYIMPYLQSLEILDGIKINHFYNQLQTLHMNTYYRKELTPIDTKKKLENIYYYLDYKFNVLESFVRSVEENKYDEYSILILKNYQYILTTKGLLAKYNKLIIDDIKAKKTCNRAFIHNNPKLNHLINYKGNDYFVSLERSKIGIPSLDMAKFYIETEDSSINHKELIDDYFSKYDDEFYYNYFYFLVMLYYIKSIVINDQDYVSSQSFLYAGGALKKFQNTFHLN